MQTPAPCDYSRATSVDDAIAQLQALGGNARILAGGYSLIPMMKLRLANPGHVIDINPLEPELSYIRREGNEIRIGALPDSTLNARRLGSSRLRVRSTRFPPSMR